MAKATLKKFDSFIEGDGNLRKEIFAENPATQQIVFELFSQLDQTYYTFFLYFFSMPMTGFWDVILSQLSAISSGSARNRNFCEDYELLRPVREVKTTYSTLKDKVTDLLGASHALWFELADPAYEEKPNTHGLWLALYDINPNRMVWEWWFEARARQLSKIWQFEDETALKEWGKSVGLKDEGMILPLAHRFKATYERATTIKHKIANPYLRLVYTITKSIAAYNQPGQFLDTFNIACTGLMRSIAKYAPSLSTAFANFADREIRYEIYYQLGNYNIISLPHKTWQKYREYEELKKTYFKTYGKEPTFEDLITTYSLPRDDVYDVYQQVGMQNPHSLDQKVYNEDKTDSRISLKDRIEDPKCAEERESAEKQQFLHLALLRMSHEDRKVFMVANGLADIVQDIAPDPTELKNFFWGTPRQKIFNLPLPLQAKYC
jgi:DNA-directed RNA polymerase specialized sigma subunit